MNPSPVLSVPKAARRLRVSRRTLNRWWAAGKIQATRYTRPSGQKVFDLAEFVTAVAKLITAEHPPDPPETASLRVAQSIADKWERRYAHVKPWVHPKQTEQCSPSGAGMVSDRGHGPLRKAEKRGLFAQAPYWEIPANSL